MLLVVVRKGNGDQNEERYNGKHHHAQHRQGQQRDIKFLIKVAVDVLTEAVGLFTGSLLLLQQVIRLHDHHGRHDQRGNDHQRNDAEQQNSKRVIVIVDLVFKSHRVKLHLHLDSAERAELFQSRNAGGAQKIQSQPLHQRYQQGLDELSMPDVAQTPDKQGQLGEGIAADKRATELLNEICFFSVATRWCKNHFCHRSHLLSSYARDLKKSGHAA